MVIPRDQGPLARLHRWCSYLRQGTVTEHLKWRWRERERAKRRGWWASQIGRVELVETEIQAGVRMRLYCATSCLG